MSTYDEITTDFITRQADGDLHLTLGRSRHRSLMWAIVLAAGCIYLFKTYPSPHPKGSLPFFLLFIVLYSGGVLCLFNVLIWFKSLSHTDYLISESDGILRRRYRCIFPLPWQQFELDLEEAPLLKRRIIGLPAKEGFPIGFEICLPLMNAVYLTLATFKEFTQAQAFGELCANHLDKPLSLSFPVEEGGEIRLPDQNALADDFDPAMMVVQVPQPSNMRSTVEHSDDSLILTTPRRPSGIFFILLGAVALLILGSMGFMLTDVFVGTHLLHISIIGNVLAIVVITLFLFLILAGPLLVVFGADEYAKRKYPFEIIVKPGEFRWRVKRGKQARFHVLTGDISIWRPAFHGSSGIKVATVEQKSVLARPKRRKHLAPVGITFGENFSQEEANYLHRLIVETFLKQAN